MAWLWPGFKCEEAEGRRGGAWADGKGEWGWESSIGKNSGQKKRRDSSQDGHQLSGGRRYNPFITALLLSESPQSKLLLCPGIPVPNPPCQIILCLQHFLSRLLLLAEYLCGATRPPPDSQSAQLMTSSCLL
ncbi:hypothetical protein OJAV_G00216330 [Oryzias javanicus]|uniref:Uncharacterized protein n=1 Tax=Oryzias javanicus TaxID=123683 RepID=A0A437C458_ORYJA|nr:hypothetical protein OJAV_G00216330 [Oryzias javanicus]